MLLSEEQRSIFMVLEGQAADAPESHQINGSLRPQGDQMPDRLLIFALVIGGIVFFSMHLRSQHLERAEEVRNGLERLANLCELKGNHESAQYYRFQAESITTALEQVRNKKFALSPEEYRKVRIGVITMYERNRIQLAIGLQSSDKHISECFDGVGHLSTKLDKLHAKHTQKRE